MSAPAPMATLQFASGDEREDLARAEVYGLLAALFLAPPSAELYARLQVAVKKPNGPNTRKEPAK